MIPIDRQDFYLKEHTLSAQLAGYTWEDIWKRERMLFCPECGLMEYPRICPAEIGETLEDTVRREVMEEVGLKVKNITYYKSQPWSFSDTLLVGFFCELDGEDRIILNENDLSLAQWFECGEIPAKDDDCSLTNEMMMAFNMSLNRSGS